MTVALPWLHFLKRHWGLCLLGVTYGKDNINELIDSHGQDNLLLWDVVHNYCVLIGVELIDSVKNGVDGFGLQMVSKQLYMLLVCRCHC